jgi:hypothetical protein
VLTPRSLADAVEARSRTASSFLTYRGLIASRPDKGYASLLFSAGRLYVDRLDGVQSQLGWSFRAVCVGYSDGQCLFVVEKIRALFVGWRPDGGVGPRFVEADDDPPLLKDDSVPEDVRYSLTLRYTLTT